MSDTLGNIPPGPILTGGRKQKRNRKTRVRKYKKKQTRKSRLSKAK